MHGQTVKLLLIFVYNLQFLHKKLLLTVKQNHTLPISWWFLVIIFFVVSQVPYDTTGFLEKNRDPVHSESLQLLQSCSSPLLRLFASSMLDQSQKSISSSGLSALVTQKRSVATKFKVIILCNYVHFLGVASMYLLQKMFFFPSVPIHYYMG